MVMKKKNLEIHLVHSFFLYNRAKGVSINVTNIYLFSLLSYLSIPNLGFKNNVRSVKFLENFNSIVL